MARKLFFSNELEFPEEKENDAEKISRFTENVFKNSSSIISNAIFNLYGVLSIEEKWRLKVKLKLLKDV